MSEFNIPIIEPTVDYTKVPPINQKRTIAFINHFIAHTVMFLNKFSLSCEEKFFQLENKLQKIEAALEILEERLSSVPEAEQKLETKTTCIENNKNTVSEIEFPIEINETINEVPKEIKFEDTETQSISSDPQYVKYFKMIHFGVPKQVVKLRMDQEGLDSSVLDIPQQLVPKIKSDIN